MLHALASLHIIHCTELEALQNAIVNHATLIIHVSELPVPLLVLLPAMVAQELIAHLGATGGAALASQWPPSYISRALAVLPLVA